MVRVLFVCLGNICRSPMGESEISRMHLTCIRADERPATEGRAGDYPSFKSLAMEGG